MNPGLMKIVVWNVRGLYGKEKLLHEELKKANVDIAVVPETKKKLKGSQELDDYTSLYSGVPTNKRAAAGIAIMIKAKFKKRIHSYVLGFCDRASWANCGVREKTNKMQQLDVYF